MINIKGLKVYLNGFILQTSMTWLSGHDVNCQKIFGEHLAHRILSFEISAALEMSCAVFEKIAEQ